MIRFVWSFSLLGLLAPVALLSGCSAESSVATSARVATAAEPIGANPTVPANRQAAKIPRAKSAVPEPAGKGATRTPRRHALLIGCTKYDHLDPRNNLIGPGNDVLLFRDLLVDHFDFKDATIVILAEGQEGASKRPTRANIHREFVNLARTAEPGDEVVILVGGHGYYLPDVNPNENDPEPDGLDECLLPCDTLPFTASSKTIGNAIRDDEIGQWIEAIRDRGAFVWYIADTCHSGSGSRDPNFDDATPPPEIDRELHFSALGIPSDIAANWLNLVKDDDNEIGEEKTRAAVVKQKPGQGKWVAIYGAQPYQKAPEMLLPTESDRGQRKMHGLLTFTICQILTRSEEPLTFGELVQKITQQYTSMGRSGPDPLVEGDGSDREVLGKHEWPGRSRLQVLEKNGRLLVTGGVMMGLTNGSVLAVYPNLNRKPEDVPVGYVKLADCSAVEARAVPCDAEGNEKHDASAPIGYAQIVKIDYSYFQPVVVAMDPLDDQVSALALKEKILARTTRTRISSASEPLRLEERSDTANWVVRSRAGKAYLIPTSGWEMERGVSTEDSVMVPGPAFGPFDLDDSSQVSRLAENIETIANAQNLLRLAPAPDGSKLITGNVNVKFEVRRHESTDDKVGSAIDFSKGSPTVKPGELLGFHITNQGQARVDVTLLFIDAAYAITPWYPKPGQVGDNRIEPGKTVGPRFVRLARINAETTGLEHMLIIAVEAKGAAVDFTYLAQGGVRERSFSHPLASLLDYATERTGSRGAMPADDEEGTAYVMRTVSWKVLRSSK